MAVQIQCDRCPRNNTDDPTWGGHNVYIIGTAPYEEGSTDTPTLEGVMGHLCDTCVSGTPTALGGLNLTTWLTTFLKPPA